MPGCGGARPREKHHYRPSRARVAADGPARLRTVHDGHHPVQQDQVGAGRGGDLQRFGAVRGRVDLVALFEQVVAHEFQDVGFVVDQQDAVFCHRSLFRFLLRRLCEDTNFPRKSCGGPGKMAIFARFLGSAAGNRPKSD